MSVERDTPMNKTRASILALVMMVAGTLLPGFATTQAAADIDVYTTPGTHTVNGRQWKTVCSKYSSTIERCRTEIWATQITLTKGRFTQTNGWAFNNLTYKPVKHSLWGKNPLANPGTWTEAGRQWKTECGTAVTGRDGCRSYIYSTVYTRSGSAYKTVNQWTFNNIVRLTPGSANFGAAKPTTPKPTTSTKREQAIKEARDYLNVMAFSRTGLIDQLEYEGYSTADSTYAVDSLKVDWRAQAVRMAKSYMSHSAFSRVGLIDQLEYEGFSTADSTYAVDSLKADWKAQAVLVGKGYLKMGAFSRAGLIDQLEFEGFSTSDATYGTDAQKANWNAQAARAAQEYLDYDDALTRAEMIDQLIFALFTTAQAEYGATAVGL